MLPHPHYQTEIGKKVKSLLYRSTLPVSPDTAVLSTKIGDCKLKQKKAFPLLRRMGTGGRKDRVVVQVWGPWMFCKENTGAFVPLSFFSEVSNKSPVGLRKC